jgi:hypothetical protein
MSFQVAIVLCALFVTSPASAQPPPPTYETVPRRYDPAALTAGALVFAASYGASVFVATTADEDQRDLGAEQLFIPLAGPWLALADRDACPLVGDPCDHEAAYKALLVIDGIFQAAGVLAMLDGFVEPASRRVPVHTARPARASSPRVRVTPTMGHGGPGVVVVGRF